MQKSSKFEVDAVHDLVNEQVVISACLVDEDSRKAVISKVSGSPFQEPKHKVIWEAVVELERRHLDFDIASLHSVSGCTVDIGYVETLLAARPEAPPNLQYHIECLLWDAARAKAVTGPIAALVEAIKDPGCQPDKVKSVAAQIVSCLDEHRSTDCLVDPDSLIANQMRDIKARSSGVAVYNYGIPGLDVDLQTKESRLTPGAFPGGITVVTGVSGSGKSTLSARIGLGLARLKRRVLVGAWEVSSGITLELMACMSLKIPRVRAMAGDLTPEEHVKLEATMHAISKYVRFMSNPFRRKKGSASSRPSNDRNLDIIRGHIDSYAPDVFIADLWRRCLAKTEPDDEEEALIAQQAMAEETKCHCILVQQQRLKDVEQRQDKRPTREGIKGSSAWVEVADTILGVHRPALWKSIPDDTLEVCVLKQRFGKWPISVEMSFDPAGGFIDGGRTIPNSFASEMDSEMPKGSRFGGNLANFADPGRKRRLCYPTRKYLTSTYLLFCSIYASTRCIDMASGKLLVLAILKKSRLGLLETIVVGQATASITALDVVLVVVLLLLFETFLR